MRKHYTASYFVGALNELGPGLEAVSDECIRWTRVTLPQGVSFSPGDELERIELDDGRWLEAMATTSEHAAFWAMRFGHPDVDDEAMEWLTEICVGHDGVEGRTAFGCTLLVGNRAGMLAPARPARSRPRIVRDVLKKWGGHHGYRLSAGPVTLRRHEVDDYVGLVLTASDRTRPLVVVSTANDTGKPIVNTKKLADWLAGVAHVVVMDPGCSRDLNARIPKRLNCWDGAVRVYWPGFGFTDEPYKHRHWAPWQIDEIDHHPRNQHGFIEYLLGWISSVAVFATDPAIPSWAEIQVMRRARLLEDAKEKGNEEELLDMAFKELDDQKVLIDQLRHEQSELSRQLQEARAQKESWQQAYQGLVRDGIASGPPSTVDAVPVQTITEAIERATSSFDAQLAIVLNGASDAESNHFESPDELFSALAWLATVYHGAKAGSAPCAELDISLREANGWQYRGRHAEITMKKYANWYTTHFQGRKLWLTEHLGTGSSKDPRRTIRVGFCWDDKSGKVVVGFIGQHQKTDAT